MAKGQKSNKEPKESLVKETAPVSDVNETREQKRLKWQEKQKQIAANYERAGKEIERIQAEELAKERVFEG